MTNDNGTPMNRTDASPPPPNDAAGLALRQWASDLMDGRLSDDELSRGLAAQRADGAEAQALDRHWHAYQWIGDAMRSAELAVPPSRDHALIDAVRARLREEPVVLAPQAARAVAGGTPRATRAWAWPMATAAGVVAVVGALVALPQATPDGAGAGFAQAPSATVPARADEVPMIRVSAPAGQVQMLRDARVDEYLRAHRESMVGAPMMLPAGLVRQADYGLPAGANGR